MEHQPSAPDVFTSSGFGATINVLYRDLVCGQSDNEFMNNIISHYLYYLDLMGVGREEARPHEELSCAKLLSIQPIPYLLISLIFL
nr:chitinase-like protein 2 [Quercus suber]